MSVPKSEFDFDSWFRWRLSRYTPEGEERRPGTLTLSELDLLTDLTYDYSRNCGVIEKKAKSVCKQAIQNSECLAVDGRGYYLKGEPLIEAESL